MPWRDYKEEKIYCEETKQNEISTHDPLLDNVISSVILTQCFTKGAERWGQVNEIKSETIKEEMSENGEFNCAICHISFGSKDDYMKHIEIHSSQASLLKYD